MTATKVWLAGIIAAVIADVAFLAEVALVEVKLIKAAFTEGENLGVADLTFADFTGSAGKSVATAVAQSFTDATTGDQIIQLREPAGGWHWETGDAVNLPQSIYGIAVTNHAGTSLLAVHALPTPVLLNAVGQGFDQGQVRFRVVNGLIE